MVPELKIIILEFYIVLLYFKPILLCDVSAESIQVHRLRIDNILLYWFTPVLVKVHMFTLIMQLNPTFLQEYIHFFGRFAFFCFSDIAIAYSYLDWILRVVISFIILFWKVKLLLFEVRTEWIIHISSILYIFIEIINWIFIKTKIFLGASFNLNSIPCSI
jgi:hypothetical protein